MNLGLAGFRLLRTPAGSGRAGAGENMPPDLHVKWLDKKWDA